MPITNAKVMTSRSRGLYLDVPPWQYHAFEMTAVGR